MCSSSACRIASITGGVSPDMPCSDSFNCWAIESNWSRSSPYTLIAIWAYTPLIMWLIMCASGCSTSISTPGTSCRTRASTSAMIASRLRETFGFMAKIYSLELTGIACSSSSARPVRRTNERISPSASCGEACIWRSVASMACAMLLDASSEEPGGNETLMRMLPSSNCGRKSRPSRESSKPAQATRAQLASSIRPGIAMLRRISGVASHFKSRRSGPSPERCVACDSGRR